MTNSVKNLFSHVGCDRYLCNVFYLKNIEQCSSSLLEASQDIMCYTPVISLYIFSSTTRVIRYESNSKKNIFISNINLINKQELEVWVNS